jgi:hypothetical protein
LVEREPEQWDNELLLVCGDGQRTMRPTKLSSALRYLGNQMGTRFTIARYRSTGVKPVAVEVTSCGFGQLASPGEFAETEHSWPPPAGQVRSLGPKRLLIAQA